MQLDEVISRLTACKDDPMWANHAEVNKKTLAAAIEFLSATRSIQTPEPSIESTVEPVAWKGMESAPFELEGNFLVERKAGSDKYIEEVFVFEGNMYPAREMAGVSWDSRVTDALRWMPIPDAAPIDRPSTGEAIPEGWVPLRIAYEPGEDPEDVAFGPPLMMNRLKKWLDKHFANLAAQSTGEASDAVRVVDLPKMPRPDVDEHNLQGGRLLYAFQTVQKYARQCFEAGQHAALSTPTTSAIERPEPLSDEQIDKIGNATMFQVEDEPWQDGVLRLARAIEAAHGIHPKGINHE